MNANALRGKIAEKGLTQQKLAAEIGISDRTLSRKIKEGSFGTDEVLKIMDVLDLTKAQASDIFLS